MHRFQLHYDTVVSYDLLFKTWSFNVMQTPHFSHLVLNSGLGQKAVVDRKSLFFALSRFESLSGQKSVVTRAKSSIDFFKVKQNTPLGCKVTLRRSLLFRFLFSLPPLFFSSSFRSSFSSPFFSSFSFSSPFSFLFFSSSSFPNSFSFSFSHSSFVFDVSVCFRFLLFSSLSVPFLLSSFQFSFK